MTRSPRTWPRALVSASEYGRFSARQFVLPATRRKFLGWLQDEYAEALARNPLARFYFVGHSNGTYLFGRSPARGAGDAVRARAARRAACCPAGTTGAGASPAGQVGELRNDRGSTDVPVGVLCGMLRGLGMTDVGTGGVDGFDWEADALTKLEVRYHPGGHSRALLPENLPSLAALRHHGRPDAAGRPGRTTSRLVQHAGERRPVARPAAGARPGRRRRGPRAGRSVRAARQPAARARHRGRRS